jgi:predicted ATPase
MLALSCGNLREAVSHFVEAERTNRKFLSAIFQVWSANPCWLALAMQLLGRVGEAGQLVAEALRRARESGHMFSLAHVLGVGGQLLHCYRREPEIVHGHADEALAIAEEDGFAFWACWGQFFRGWALAELGQLEQGVAEMEDEIPDLDRLGMPWRQYANALLAQGYARMGRTDEAPTMLDQALTRIEHTGERMGHADILRLKGEVLLMRDGAAAAEAEHCFRTALEVAHQQEAKWWELRTTVSLARLLRDTNRPDEAQSLLAEIYNWFTEGFDLPDLKEAKALLDELGR